MNKKKIRTFNKLIRDNMPMILADMGKTTHTTKLSEQAYVDALRAKLSEEVDEYLTDRTPEELADILEVVFALAASHNLSIAELMEIRNHKKDARGGFAQRIFLHTVEEEATP